MNLNLIANVMFAIAVVRVIELVTEEVTSRYQAKKRKERFTAELEKLKNQLLSSFDDDDDECDCGYCYTFSQDDYVTFEKYPTLEDYNKSKAKKKPVKKAVAKKKTVKKTAPKKVRK